MSHLRSERYIFKPIPEFDGISFRGVFESATVRHLGDVNNKFLYKEGAFENRRYFYICSFTKTDGDYISIELTNGNSSLIGGTIDVYLGVDVFYYDSTGQQIFRTGFSELVRQPTRIEERRIPSSAFVAGGKMKVVWWVGIRDLSNDGGYVTWSGTF